MCKNKEHLILWFLIAELHDPEFRWRLIVLVLDQMARYVAIWVLATQCASLLHKKALSLVAHLHTRASLRTRMQTATPETESKSLDLSICVHHYTFVPKAREF